MRLMTWNVQNGGVDADGSDERWRTQIDIISEANPDVLTIQEGKYWTEHGSAPLYATEQALGMRALLAPAPLVGCHTAVLVKPHIQPVRFDLAYSPLAWHALAPVRLNIDGPHEQLTVVSVHLSPYSPEHRLIETALLPPLAEPGMLTIAAGDFNSVPPGDPEPNWTHTPDAELVRHVLPFAPGETPTADRRPGELLKRAGYLDTAPAIGERHRVPTARHYRCDQVWLSRSAAPMLADYQVIDNDLTRRASDHRPVVIDMDLDRMSSHS